MNRTDFLNFILEFEEKLQKEAYTIKNSYDSSERQEIYKMCRKFSRVSIPEYKGLDDKVKKEVLRPYFLRSLSVFNSELITKYFADKTKNLKIIRSSVVSDERVKLKYSFGCGRPTTFKMFIPKDELTFSDQIGYAHEIGHIPETDYLKEKYLEYSEALPMFMEFIINFRRYPDFQDAFNHFLFARLPEEQIVARDVMKICKNANNSNELIAKYHQLLLAEWYSFLESLEFAIQLILRSKDDMVAVTEEIEQLLEGKSLIAVADTLDIKTTGCPCLQKEYQRIGKL